MPRIKEKTYKKLSKPFTLLVKVCLLKKVFLTIVLVPVALKSEKRKTKTKNKTKKQTNKKQKNSQYFVMPVSVAKGKK